MATAVNPRIIDMSTAELVDVGSAASMTGRKGVPIVLAAGLATVCSDGDIPWGCLAEDVTTAKTTGTATKCYRWRVGTRLEMYVASGGASSAIGTANKGLDYDLQIIGSGATAIGYVDIGATTDKIFRVIDIAAEYEPIKNATADDPGKCIVEVMAVQSA